MAEVVQDGINGHLVEPGRPDQLAETIIRALDPGELARLAAGTSHARKKFSWGRFAQILLNGDGSAARHHEPPAGIT
jgi:glycosyltransferase involved in cell wall biosynthesis